MADTADAAQKTTLTVTIDGRAVEAEPGEWLIAAAERHGVYVPRFCYHPRMRPVGMCRMCLVEVETPRGPALQTACTATVADGMVVSTANERVKKAQDGVLEFLLINHPLDCPVCDKGGECPLQDQTLAFGPGESRFVEEKRHFEKPIPISEVVYLDRERCILCDRCTRFADEVAGDPLISFVNRGGSTEVNTFPDDPFASYFSGNTVQICPVGALTAKPYRFRARPWDLDQVESTCTSCSVGCRVAVQSSSNQVVRYLGIDVDPVNWGWMCDRGRFDFEALNSGDRLSGPLVREADELRPASWAEAMARAAEGLRGARERHGEGALAVLGGSRLANEDAYAWAKLAKSVLGTDHVDAQLGDGLPAEVVLGLPRATIDEACAADVVLLLGPDLKEEVPVLHLRLRDAAVWRGLKVVELATHDTGMTEHATVSLRYAPGSVHDVVQQLLAGAEGDGRPELAAAAELLRSGDVVCVLGRPSLAESAESVVAAAGALHDALPGVRFLSSLRRGNVHGALDMGLAPGVLPGRVGLEEGRSWFGQEWAKVPGSRGLDATGILSAAAEGRIQGLVLLGANPVDDFPDRDLARRGVTGAGFVVAVDTFLTESSRQADVVLPAAGYAERPGTTTNLEGRVSRLAQKVTAVGTSRPDWMIAVELADRLGVELGFTTLDEIWDEVERLAPSHRGLTREALATPAGLDGLLAPLHTEELDREVTRPAQTEAPGETAPELHRAEPETAATGGRGDALTDTTPESSSAMTVDTDAQAEAQVAEAASAASREPGDDQGQHEAAAAAASDQAAADAAEGEGPTGGVRGTPSPLRFSPVTVTTPRAVDSYSLRLISGRKLYDAATSVVHSPSLAPLAPGGTVRAHPFDLDRLGVRTGTAVRVRSARGALVLEAAADPDVPRGTAVIWFNQPGAGAADLIDARAAVNDVRLETVAEGAR
jgi:NADH-quinone oxidoreductase subunit G